MAVSEVSLDKLLSEGCVISGVNLENYVAHGQHYEEEVDLEDLLEPISNTPIFKSPNLLQSKTPFDDLAAKMVNIDPHGLIKKEIVKAGAGKNIQPGDVVLVNYEFNFEGEEPFDSSLKRNKVAKWVVKEGQMLEGIFVAILSMQPNEASRFLLHYLTAFGEMGVPPRIKPKADVFAEIELIRIVEVNVPEIVEEMPTPGVNVQAALLKADQFINCGKSRYMKRDFSGAVKEFWKGITLLEHTPTNNDQEWKKVENMILRLRVNLAGVFEYRNKFEQTCSMCQEIIRIDPNNQKGILMYSNALMQLTSFERSQTILKRGLTLYPGDVKMKNLWDELEKRMSQKREASKASD